MERVSQLEKTNDNQQDIKKKIQEIKLALNKIYVERGNTKEVVKMSQELDEYILIQQEKILKTKQRKNEK